MTIKLRKLIGTRAFYAMVMAVVLPIIVQNAITNFVNLLDNLMVGRTGTDPMSGVAITNQLMFVFNLVVFGAVSGAGIFTAQFKGAGNLEGVRSCFRYKLYVGALMTTLAIVLFLLLDRPLISLYLTDTSDPVRVEATLGYAQAYLRIMLLGLPPFMLAQCYASTLRETGETKLPMVASIVAVFVNLVFNYLLIFGKLGFPRLGVEGAAWATVLSRYLELAIVSVRTHTHAARFTFAKGLYRTMRIPADLVRRITVKGMPLLANEILWAVGMTMLVQIYSYRGLDVVAAHNISSVIFNLFGVIFLSMGSASAIIVGQALGKNDYAVAKDHSWKLIAFAFALAIAGGLIVLAISPFAPLLYNTSDEIRALASRLIRVTCLMMPFDAVCNCSYFILRSGGKTMLTFLFDTAFAWVVCVPLAYVLAHFTGLPIVPLYLCVQGCNVLKAALGIFMLRKGVWLNNIVSDAKVQ